MKRSRLFYFLLVTLLLVGAVLPSARASKPATPPPADQTTLKMHELTAPGGNLNSSSTLLNNGAGYNIARQFTIGNQAYLLLLDGNRGAGLVQQIQAGGQLGGTPQFIYPTDALRATSAEIISIGGTTYLMTHHAFSGKLRHFPISQSGVVQTGAPYVLTQTVLRDKHLFSPFIYNGQYHYFGLDTFTGQALVRLPNEQTVEAQFSRGWTSVDHLTVGATTYRLYYKAAGDPHKDDSDEIDNNDKAGRLVIQRLTGNGLSGDNTYEGLTGADWSQVRFMRSFNNDGSIKHALFFYNRANGDYRVLDFNPQTGLPGFIVTGQGDLGAGATDIETYSAAAPQLYVYTLTGDGATPLAYDQIEKMAHTIHNEMANKAVGYQFALLQSGRVVYSRAWGKQRLDVPAEMTNGTRLNLGSVGKMITAVSVLKLAEQGDIQLLQPLAGQLDPAKYPNPAAWVSQRTPFNLLTHTSGKSGGACREIYLDANGAETFTVTDTPTYKTDCTNFLNGAPDADLVCGTTPKRDYNNANFGTLRELIEHARGVQTSQGVDSQTGALWANAAGLGGLTCQYEPNVRYFARCNEQNDCYQANGKSWYQAQPPTAWAPSCGAGGWSASSREMLEFMAAIRYERILSPSFNNLLLYTDLNNCNSGPGSTAVSWEEPWTAEAETLLGKGGSGTDDGDGWGYRAYISRLPRNADVVLLVNTAIPNPTGLVQDAYKYAVGENNSAPAYVQFARTGEENDEAATGEIDRLETNTVAYSEPQPSTANQHYVTAARLKDTQQMKLTSWYVESDGAVSRSVDTVVAGTVKDIAISDGQAFVTAVRKSNDQLQLSTWTTNSQADTLSYQASTTADTVSKVAVAKLAGSGVITGRVVTATRNGGNLHLIVWDFDNTANTITPRDAKLLGPISEVAVHTVRYGSNLSATTRFVTAVRNGSQKMQVDLWEVNSSGQITRLGGEVTAAEVSGSASSQKKIALGEWGTEDFFVAFIKDDDLLQLYSWKTNAAGDVYDRKQQPATATTTAKTEVAITGTTTVVRKSDGKLQMIYWGIGSTGEITLKDSADAGAVKLVAAAGRVLTPISLGDNKLKLIHWELVE